MLLWQVAQLADAVGLPGGGRRGRLDRPLVRGDQRHVQPYRRALGVRRRRWARRRASRSSGWRGLLRSVRQPVTNPRSREQGFRKTQLPRLRFPETRQHKTRRISASSGCGCATGRSVWEAWAWVVGASSDRIGRRLRPALVATPFRSAWFRCSSSRRWAGRGSRG